MVVKRAPVTIVVCRGATVEMVTGTDTFSNSVLFDPIFTVIT
jgi:hypothetical protein